MYWPFRDLLGGGEARRVLLQPLNAEELRAQDLVTVPRRERSPAAEGATEGIGPVSPTLPGRKRWGQGCDLAVRPDRPRGRRRGVIRCGHNLRARTFPRRVKRPYARREKSRRTDLTCGSTPVRQLNTSSRAAEP